MKGWLHKFLSEMRHRRVWRVGAAYAVGAAGVLEVADLTVEALSAPPEILTWLVPLVLGGFPLAMAGAWVFDLTPKGITRTPEIEQESTYRSSTAFLALLLVSVAIAGLAGWFLGHRLDQPVPIRAIAVLPLTNLTGDPEQEYFVDGFHESLISELSRLPDVDVISRTSVIQYKNKNMSLQKIGEELGVTAVVEGSVLRFGNRVTVIANLVRISPERNLWSGQYERSIEKITTLTREIVFSIAKEVQLSLRPADEQRLTNEPQIDTRAYDELMRGRSQWRIQTAEAINEAIIHFNNALIYEPNYAEAYANLAESYISLSWVGANPLAPDQAFPRARSAALRALQIDDSLADAHAAMGLVAWRYRFDPVAAEQAFARALETEPSNAKATHWMALFMATRGRAEEAKQLISRAMELDPLSLLITANHGWIQYFDDHPTEALVNAHASMQLWPDSGIPFYHQGLALASLGQFEEAIVSFRESIKRSGPLSYLLASMAYSLAQAGNLEEASAIQAELSGRDYTAPYLLAMVEVGLGDNNAALDLLEICLSVHDAYLAFLAVDPVWDPLRLDARFMQIMKDAGHTIL